LFVDGGDVVIELLPLVVQCVVFGAVFTHVGCAETVGMADGVASSADQSPIAARSGTQLRRVMVMTCSDR
jgi:hypothetical protein